MGRLNLKKPSTSSKTSKRVQKAKAPGRPSKPARKKEVLKKKPGLQHKITLVKKIPPISQRAPKLLKRNEVVVLDHTEYKWTGSLWVHTKDNIVAPLYTSDRLNIRYPNRESTQKIVDTDPKKEQSKKQ
jgi:hypothetical protein